MERKYFNMSERKLGNKRLWCYYLPKTQFIHNNSHFTIDPQISSIIEN